MDENKFTPTAEEALQLAQEAAGELGHGYMGTEHLLLGLMREDEGLAHTVLTEAGLTDDLLTEMIRKAAGSRPADNSGSAQNLSCLLYTSPSPRDISGSRMPSSA